MLHGESFVWSRVGQRSAKRAAAAYIPTFNVIRVRNSELSPLQPKWTLKSPFKQCYSFGLTLCFMNYLLEYF